MFESVLERNLPPRQIGRGAGLAIGVHAVIIAAALHLSTRPAPAVDKEIRAFTVFSQPKMAQPGPANEGGGSPPSRSRTEHRSPRSNAIEIDRNKRRAEEPSASTSVSPDTLGSGDHATSPETPGTGGPGRGEGSGAGVGGGGTTIAVPFGEGMTRPTPIHQPAPVYTREASAARSHGTVSVRCVITVEGTLRDCRIIQGVPFMDGAVLDALSHWKYSPVMFQGRPVSVYYAINVRIVAP